MDIFIIIAMSLFILGGALISFALNQNVKQIQENSDLDAICVKLHLSQNQASLSSCDEVTECVDRLSEHGRMVIQRSKGKVTDSSNIVHIDQRQAS